MVLAEIFLELVIPVIKTVLEPLKLIPEIFQVIHSIPWYIRIPIQIFGILSVIYFFFKTPYPPR